MNVDLEKFERNFEWSMSRQRIMFLLEECEIKVNTSQADVLLAESYIVKYDEYISIENNIELPMEIDFGGNLKIYVDDGYIITKAVDGWGKRAADVIGKKVEVYKKIFNK